MVEQRFCKPKVAGSIPAAGTSSKAGLGPGAQAPDHRIDVGHQPLEELAHGDPSRPLSEAVEGQTLTANIGFICPPTDKTGG
jgi:hypothetical protein